jgi:pantetheine-phosphate adenylyltransferase
MKRACELFDELIVGVYDHARPSKSILFSIEERIAMIETALNGQENISVLPYSSLTVDFAHEVGARIIIRGLRVFSDFEFEFRLALANQRLSPEIENVNLMTREQHTFLSGTIVREIASLGGDISSMVPPNVDKALQARFAGNNGDDFNSPLPLRD